MTHDKTPTQPGFAPQHDKATIEFASLQCIRKRDVSGHDEPHLFIDGCKVWHGKMGKGDEVNFDKLARLKFENGDERFRVVLQERNERANGPNDYKILGAIYLTADSESPATFAADGAHYNLFYKHI